MAVVIVRAPLGLAGAHRQDRLAAIQRLHLTLLIHTQHHRAGLLGWIQIQSDKVAHLLHKDRIGGEFEVFLQMRLESESPPDAHDGVLVESAGLGHGAGVPVRRLLTLKNTYCTN